MGKIISLAEFVKKKVEKENKAQYNLTIRNILKLVEHLTPIKSPKEGSDAKEEDNPRNDGN